MQQGISKAVLITGCSTGIGRTTASHLAGRGFTVYATARRPETLEALKDQGCHTLRLDVTDEDSMREAVATVEANHGAVGILINNAGYGLEGPIEELSIEQVRQQFETNLFGPTLLTQLVIPAMRAQGWGKIVNVSSVGGRITTPGNGAYHASKHALEALCDVLRFELCGFGIDVIVVEPGAIKTQWVNTAVSDMEGRLDASSPYSEFSQAVAAQMQAAHEGLLGLTSGPPEVVAKVIEQSVTCAHPRTRYVAPVASRLFIALHKWLPDSLWDALMRRVYPTPVSTDLKK